MASTFARLSIVSALGKSIPRVLGVTTARKSSSKYFSSLLTLIRGELGNSGINSATSCRTDIFRSGGTVSSKSIIIESGLYFSALVANSSLIPGV